MIDLRYGACAVGNFEASTTESTSRLLHRLDLEFQTELGTFQMQVGGGLLGIKILSSILGHKLQFVTIVLLSFPM
jgi:hypothetical protein